jgi:hypothetical protein
MSHAFTALDWVVPATAYGSDFWMLQIASFTYGGSSAASCWRASPGARRRPTRSRAWRLPSP